MMAQSFNKLSKFVVVGIIATAIHVVIASWLITGTYHYAPGFANIVAFVVATSFSYIANTKWSFADQIRYTNFYRFLITALTGSVLAYSLSTMADYLGFHYLVGILFIVICVPMLSFLAHNVWTYKH